MYVSSMPCVGSWCHWVRGWLVNEGGGEGNLPLRSDVGVVLLWGWGKWTGTIVVVNISECVGTGGGGADDAAVAQFGI